MKISFYDTMSKQIREFIPTDESRITVYKCGPTVYSTPHIGNARSAVAFDVLYRTLVHIYGDDAVLYSENLTDIDDKIIDRAQETNQSIEDLTNHTIGEYRTALDALNVLRPTFTPRATQSIPEMVQMIAKLIEKGHAYQVKGHVFFSVKSHAGHGCLSGQVTEDNQDGVRIETSSLKTDPADFVLWKPSTAAQPGWISPWGIGRPGWHIECSAMIDATLGETIDIHGGGVDLVFPHHEAEIAQSESLTGKPLANYWVHNGMLTVDGRKMSKSAGNVVTVPEILERYDGEVLRYLLLGGHYRQPIDFTWEKMTAARAALDGMYRALESFPQYEAAESAARTVNLALMNDLNTAEALAHMHTAASLVASSQDELNVGKGKGELIAGGKLLGILQRTPDEWFGRTSASQTVLDLVAKRSVAREENDWVLSDQLRDEISALGYTVEDKPEGTIWRRT